MPDHNKICHFFSNKPDWAGKEFSYLQVLAELTQLLSERTIPGKTYAVLRFLQLHCKVVFPVGGDMSTPTDPRKHPQLDQIRRDWKFRIACNRHSSFVEKTPDAINVKVEAHIGESEANERLASISTEIGSGDLLALISDQFVDYLANKPFRLYAYVSPRVWYPLHGPAVGWQQRLNAYLWGEANWAATLASLSPLVADFAGLTKMQQDGIPPSAGAASALFDRVVTWGGTGHASQTDGVVENALAAVAAYLNAAAGRPAMPAAPINSTWTKVFALAFPDDFVIYDTRVAAALISVAEDLYRRNFNDANNRRGLEANIEDFRRVYGALGTMTTASRGGTRPRGVRYRHWPNAYGSWAAQIDANNLCQGIRDSLNRQMIDGRSNWTLREVEAVLFMEGY